MRKSTRTDELVERACYWLGRQNRLSGFLDWIARWVVPDAPRLVLAAAGAALGADALITAPMRMATGPDLDLVDGGTVRDVRAAPVLAQGAYAENEDPANPAYVHPTNANSKRLLNDRLTHSALRCAADKYHGMHGRPCAYMGGTDLKCPKGTVAGWFWRYKTAAGVYYYVDCCGKALPGEIWCNWSAEANWCVAAGDNHGYAAHKGGNWGDYTCTLAIPDGLMRTAKDTASSGGVTSEVYHVIGAD